MVLFKIKEFIENQLKQYEDEVKDAKELQDKQKEFNTTYVSPERKNELALLSKIGEIESVMHQSNQAGESSGSHQFGGNTVAEMVWTFFLTKGFHKKAIAGIMGNLEQESGMKPTAVQNGGRGPGTGLVQWGNGMDGGRWNDLEAWASKNGKDKWAAETQLEWLWIEMEQKYHLNLFSRYLKERGYTPGNSPLEAFKKVDNIEDSVYIFERTIERAGHPAYANRNRYAKNYYNQLKDFTAQASGGVFDGDVHLPCPSSNRLTSPYGMRIHPIQKVPKMHQGIDLAGGGLDIWSIFPGTVSISKYHSGLGNYIKINHGTVNGKKVESLYGHLKSMKVKAGDTVSQGQSIGVMGTTGGSTGVHLHFEIFENGARVDPEKYVKYKKR